MNDPGKFCVDIRRKQFGQHPPKRIEIRSDGDTFTGALLRRHIRGCSRNLTHIVSGSNCQPEIEYPDLSAAVDHDVGGFQIPMQHAARVCGTQPGGELPCHLESLCAGRLSDAAKQRRQRFAVHVPSIDK